MEMNISGVLCSNFSSLFGMQNKFYVNTYSWHPYVDRLARETRIVPVHLDKMRLGSGPITLKLIEIIRTPAWGDAMNFSGHLEKSGIFSQPVTFNLIQTIIFSSKLLRATRKIVEAVGSRVILRINSKYLFPNTGNMEIRTPEENIR